MSAACGEGSKTRKPGHRQLEPQRRVSHSFVQCHVTRLVKVRGAARLPSLERPSFVQEVS